VDAVLAREYAEVEFKLADAKEGELFLDMRVDEVVFDNKNAKELVSALTERALDNPGCVIASTLEGIHQDAGSLRIHAWSMTDQQKDAQREGITIFDENAVVRTDLLRRDMNSRDIVYSYVTDNVVIFGADKSELVAEINEVSGKLDLLRRVG
jgi:hypothetical protein